MCVQVRLLWLEEHDGSRVPEEVAGAMCRGACALTGPRVSGGGARRRHLYLRQGMGGEGLRGDHPPRREGGVDVHQWHTRRQRRSDTVQADEACRMLPRLLRVREWK